jgi:hypothetical protein
MRVELTGDSRKLDRAEFTICNTRQILFGDGIKMDGVGRTCDSHNGEDEYLQGLVENLKKKENLEDLVVDGRIILKCILIKYFGSTLAYCS